jgi:hypothetical protein
LTFYKSNSILSNVYRRADERRPGGYDRGWSLYSLAQNGPGRLATRGEEGSMTYSNPYLAGLGLGLVLLAAFVITGHGLGASGAFATTAAGTVAAVAPGYAASNPYFGRYLASPGGPWRDWLLFEVIGMCIGGFVSAAMAGRLARVIERGAGVSAGSRLVTAAGGGAVMGLGAVLARGCTSGLALTGGALLSVGSWAFMLSAFAAAYAVAPLLRRSWR